MAISAGLQPADFYKMTWWEYCSFMQGVKHRHFEAWQHTRRISFVIRSTIEGALGGEFKLNEQEFMPLLFDEKPKKIREKKQEGDSPEAIAMFKQLIGR